MNKMTKEAKLKQKSIQHVSNLLLNMDLTADDIVHRKEEQSTTEAFLIQNKGKQDVKLGDVIIPYNIMLEYCNHVDEMPEEMLSVIPLRLSLADIETDLATHLQRSWRSLSYKEKTTLLWHYGMNCVASKEDSSKYWVVRCLHRNRKDVVINGLCIVGAERLDKDWIKSGKASIDAYTFTKDPELKKDLYIMSR